MSNVRAVGARWRSFVVRCRVKNKQLTQMAAAEHQLDAVLKKVKTVIDHQREDGVANARERVRMQAMKCMRLLLKAAQ